MKKFIMITLTIVVVLGAVGYSVWHFGTKIASEKIIEQLESNLDSNSLKEVKSYLEKDPQVQDIISEAATINPDTLPFQTKEDATRMLITKVGVNRILEIKEQAENGSINQDELLSEIESKLSEDEISALKYVLYTELIK